MLAAGQRTPGFLELFLCGCMHVCVYPPPRLLITSGMMWCDIDPYNWLNTFYDYYMAVVVGISSGRDVSIYKHCGTSPIRVS